MQATLNGTLTLVSGEKALISREVDFFELLAYSTKEYLFKVAEALKALCTEFGEARSLVMDLYRQRLSQLRKHLQTA